MDYVVRAIDEKAGILAFCGRTTNLVEKARLIHDTLPTASAAFGRLLTASALMGLMLKGEKDTVTLRVDGGGSAGIIVAHADSKGNVKGFIGNPGANIPLNQKGKLDVAGIVGSTGTLTVVKDLGLKEPYVGQVPLVSGEIAEDLTYYFDKSEQIPSSVALGVLVDTDGSIKASGGFIIQLLPRAEEKAVASIEEQLKSTKPVTQLIEDKLSPEDILKNLLKDFEITFTAKHVLNYHCSCSKEKIERILLSLGKNEVDDILRSQGTVELICNYCRKSYRFEKEDIDKIFSV
ncbi:Hsp33 family molecular chaperone HslO [Thermovenabulum gondwanense]|uniref:33 kDa chaperonin n=1 Tax=Thermovenabulum gondwanense TaxID=520767 RepID=A0A161QCT9_9FIRM|nr:Hsp33 family molecular chaperone HslO [Thermovenabulum gondwanense]KYO67264.1 33 kDa chaperonin [Thermovenabulum gondwanense]